MRKYVTKPMETLAVELTAGLARLRKGYVDAAEELLRIIDPQGQYPHEFIVYRITGYRPGPREEIHPPIPGKTLHDELLRLMLDLCESFNLKAADYNEKVYDIPGMARACSISTKTIQRWCRQGLPARQVVFPDGKRKRAFLESSVRWFTRAGRGRIDRSSRFSRMTVWDRNDIIRRARRMAGFTRCTLGEVAHRLARRTGRAVETVRYTIRKHDLEKPQEAIFPEMTGPLEEAQRDEIHQAFLSGQTAPDLARQFHRTRGSIYRIINEVRATRLLARKIDCVYNSQFDLPNADELILPQPAEPAAGGEQGLAKRHHKFPQDLPPYLQSLYDIPLLDATAEHNLFRRYNYLKHKAEKLRRRIDPHNARAGDLKEVESLLVAANAVKNRIIRANLRLVVSIAKKHVGGPQNLFELISDGNVSLMRAVEKFDYTRGNRFSTYASWAIMRNFARTVPRERYRFDRFTADDDAVDVYASLQSYDPNEVNLPELRESIEAVLSHLQPVERSIVMDHYGIGQEDGGVKTLEQLGKKLGVSKERVRQIEIQAFRKLRQPLLPQKSDLL